MLKTVIFAIFWHKLRYLTCKPRQPKYGDDAQIVNQNDRPEWSRPQPTWSWENGWRKGELWVIGVVPTTNPPMLKLERLEWEKTVLQYQWVWTRVFCCTFVGVRYLYIYLPLFHSRWGVLLMEAWMGYL